MSGISAKKIEIINYYDRLISDMDIYTEESVEEMYPDEPMTNHEIETNLVEPEFDNLNEYDSIKAIFNKLHEPFRFNLESNCADIGKASIKYTNKIDYFNAVRKRSIEEIKRIQKTNVEKLNTKVNPQKPNNEESCCLVNIGSYFLAESIKFRLLTLIFDFSLNLNEQDAKNLGYWITKGPDYAIFNNFNDNIILDEKRAQLLCVAVYVRNKLSNFKDEIIKIQKEKLYEIEELRFNEIYIKNVNIGKDWFHLKFLELISETKQTLIIELEGLQHNLACLSLKYFKIESLNKFVCLTKLQQLKLSKCDFATESLLPQLFNNLEIVEINDCVKNFPIQNLINAKYLSLSTTKENCKIIGKLPPSLANLVSLKIHGFEFGNLWSSKTIINIFENLTSLEHLDLSNNQEMYWNTEWSKCLVNLKSLNLNNAKFDNLIHMFVGLINLEFLSLQNMKKMEIDENKTLFANLKNLKYLDISKNYRSVKKVIEAEQNMSTHLENLEYLIMDSIYCINFAQFIFDKFKFVKLKKLFISCENDSYDTGYDFFPKLPNTLIELTLTQTPGLRLYDNCLSHLTNLKYLDLSNNFISFDGENLFASQHQLQVLDLSINMILSFGENSFSGLDSLRTLKLHYNRITEFNCECVGKMKNLRFIYLDHTISNALQVKKNLNDLNIICKLRP